MDKKQLPLRIKIISGLIVAFILFLIINPIVNKKSDTDKPEVKEEAKVEETKVATIDEAKKVCQVETITTDYLKPGSTLVSESGETKYNTNTGMFTVNKTPITTLEWQGSDPDGKAINFLCSVGKLGERYSRHELSIDGIFEYKQELYDKDGKVVKHGE